MGSPMSSVAHLRFVSVRLVCPRSLVARRIVRYRAFRRWGCFRPLVWESLFSYEIVWRYIDLVLPLSLGIDKGKIVIGEIVILIMRGWLRCELPRPTNLKRSLEMDDCLFRPSLKQIDAPERAVQRG